MHVDYKLVDACYDVKINKSKPGPKNQKGWGRGVRRSWIRLKMGLVFDNFYNTFVILCGTIDSGR